MVSTLRLDIVAQPTNLTVGSQKDRAPIVVTVFCSWE